MTIKDKGQFVRSDHTLYEPTRSTSPTADYWGGGDGTTTYQHVAKDQIYPGKFHSDAELKVEYQGASGTTQYPPAELLDGQPAPKLEGTVHERLAARADRLSNGGPMFTDDENTVDKLNDWARRSEHSNTTGIPGQQALIINSSSPATATVDLMRSTRGGRVANMTQLGMAARDVMLERGLPLLPSDDLSPHSTRIVEKMRDKGLVSDSFEKKQSNSLTFNNRPMQIDDYPTQPREYQPVSPEALAGGRRAIRSILQRNKRQGEQGSFW